jgi:hypothetical protein
MVAQEARIDEALPPLVFHGTSNAYMNYAYSFNVSQRRTADAGKYRTYLRDCMRRYRARKRDQPS